MEADAAWPQRVLRKTLHFSPYSGERFGPASTAGASPPKAADGLLLREVEKRIGIVRQFAACFRDYRNADLIAHTVEELVAQRVYGLALGYEDLNDHEELRKDPLLAVLVEKSDPVGQLRPGNR